jgi:hypothetical protein
VSDNTPLNRELVNYYYEAYCANALKQLMKENITLFYQYTYYYQLRDTPFGAPDEEENKELNQWVYKQQAEFKQLMHRWNKDNEAHGSQIKEDALNQLLKEVIEKEYPMDEKTDESSKQLDLCVTHFKELSLLSAIASYSAESQLLHTVCGLGNTKKPLLSVLNSKQSIESIIVQTRQRLCYALKSDAFINELEQCDIIQKYMLLMNEETKTQFAKMFWPIALELFSQRNN